MGMQTEHIDDLAEGYALGALDPSARTTVEDHLAVCPPCAQHVRTLEDAAQMLGFVAAPAAPPLRCKRNVLEKIEREQFLATPTRRSRPALSAGLWASFATVALVMMSMYTVSMQRQLTATRSEAEQARAELASAQAILGSMQSELVQYTSLDQAIADGRELRKLSAENANAKGVTLMSPGKNEAWVVISGLPPLPSGQAYQVWVARGEEQQPLTVFNVTNQPTLRVKIVPPEPMDRYEAIMITVEDARGATKPSERTVLSGNL